MSNLLKRWKATWNPDMYHGWGKEKNYFEGWYFKIVDPTEQYAFAIIPGISKDKNGKQHAFIQVMDGKKCTAAYHNFEASAFQPSAEKFELILGDNSFSKEQLSLNVPELKGSIRFIDTIAWPKMLGAPGIMGWYSFVPFMECYHGIVSLNHQIEGAFEIDGKKVDFTGGKGYIEKDWGQSFPNAWIWMQTNHFDEDYPISLTASTANIPWVGNHFIGYIVGFYIKDKLYRFATYTGAMMKAVLEEDKVLLSFKDRKHRLEIVAHKAEGSDLISPIAGDMVGKVNESMQAVVDVQFFKGEKCIFSGSGRNTGMEIAGKVEKILTDRWRR